MIDPLEWLVSEKAFPIHEEGMDAIDYLMSEEAFPIHDEASEDDEPEQKNCGTGAGGFQPGNECGKGDGEGGEEKPKRTPRSRKPKTTENMARPSNEEMKKATQDAVAEIEKMLDKPDAWQDMTGEFVEERKMAARERLTNGLKSALENSEAASILEEDSGNKRNAMLRLQRINEGIDADIVNAANYFDKLSPSGQREYMETLQRGVKAMLGNRISADFMISGAIKDGESQPEAMMRCAVALKVAHGLARAASIFDSEAESTFTRPSISGRGVTILSRSESNEHPKAAAYYDPSLEAVVVYSDEYNGIGGGSSRRASGTEAPIGWGSQLMVHEITHANHYIAEMDRRGKMPKWDPIPEPQAKLMRENEMRPYAFTNQVEFVAVFAEEVGKGARFTEDLWKLYDKQGGPKIRPSVRKAATLRISK